MGGYFEPAGEELLDIAQDVLEKHHPFLAKQARFGFAFLSEAPKRKGRKILAQVSLVPARTKFHLSLDYLIWVAHDEWDKLGEVSRRAVLDHEFCHCAMNDNSDWTTRDHDIQEFTEIIERYGLWNSGLVRLSDVIQGALPLEDEQETEGTVVAAPVSAFVELA